MVVVSGYTWFASLPLTSVSANTAIYNSSAAFVFIFSIFLVKESITVLKVIAVVVATGGVIIVSLFGSGQEVFANILSIVG